MIGTLFGHFRLEAKLGQGGMGVVYRARDEKLHRSVALKLLSTEWAADPTARARLLREARAAASLTHRNVATVYEVGEQADQIFLALELIEGRSLRSVLQESRPSLTEALRIATGIVRGVAKAHEREIVHRDLKPENVMLTEEGEVKVLDFGLARQVDRADAVDALGATGAMPEVVTKTGQIMGTPAYMSPEQATGQRLDVRSDVFSLGLILYELTAGRHPFQGRSPIELAVAIVTDQPAPASSLNPDITPGLDRIIATCLAKAPRDRYSSARDLLRELERLTQESPAAAPITSEARPRLRRSRVLVVGLPAAVIAIAGVSLWIQRVRKKDHVGEQPALATFAAPPPRSPNPEAVRVYLDGLQAERDGREREATAIYYRALELDPDLAPALLRVALRGVESNMAPADELRGYFRRALSLRASLDDRDQARLDAWEPVMQRDPADDREAIRRLRAALHRFPDDRRIAGDLVGLICSSPDIAPETRIAEAKTTDLRADRLADVTACTRADLSKPEDLWGEQDSCERTPTDLSCLGKRASSLARQGKCAESEAVARRMMTLDPKWHASVKALATALLGQPGQEESVREVLRKWTEGHKTPKQMLWGEISIAISTGDFATAIERIRALDDLVKDQREEKDHADAVWSLAPVLEEIGKPRDAARVARAFLARRAAYEPNPGRNAVAIGQDPTGILLAIERRAGGLSPEQYREQLQTRLDWWDRRLGKTSWLRYSVWQTQYAYPAQTAAEAREAMAALPQFGRVYNADARVLGRTHVLAGMINEALPELE